jgi:hypothetical protein
MTTARLLALLLVVATTLFSSAQTKRRPTPAPKKSAPKTVSVQNIAPDIQQRVARFKQVNMPFQSQGLSAREKQLVEKLVEANRDIEDIFWRQNDPEALTLYQRLAGATNARGKALRDYLFINGSRYDLFDENRPFVGNQPFYPGRGFFPEGVTREQLESYVQQHPEQKDAIYSNTTVVRRNGESFATVPYHVAYRSFLEPAAKALREAADLSDDRAFASFLRARADALLNDDYYPSDLAWVDLKDPKFDIIFAPYETYNDDLLGVKATYGGAVLIRNEAESRKLAMYQQHIADLQDSLPLAAEDKPSKRGHLSPMEVMDAPFRAGDLNHGYQAVADNLPNDPRIHQEKGSKKIFFKNFMDARVNYIILPIAKKLLRAGQAQYATPDGYMGDTLLHEISHELGPTFARRNGKQVDIREAIGPQYSALEEAKADVVGLFAAQWLTDRGVLRKERLPELYAAHVADFFRTARLSAAEAHGLAGIMEFNYLAEQKVIVRDADGKYGIDLARMPNAIAALARELLEQEATGDRARTEAWFKKYGSIPAGLKTSLSRTDDVPIDIVPTFSFAANLE